jgi:single-strand DNA-binding protein
MVPETAEQLRKATLMKNTVTLVGFVGNNPEVRTTQGGASITSVSLATSRSYKDAEGNRQTETEWHRITCFNGVGKSVAEHVTKGALIMVTGRIHYTRWTDKDGQSRYGCEFIAEQVDFLTKAKKAPQDEPNKRSTK